MSAENEILFLPGEENVFPMIPSQLAPNLLERRLDLYHTVSFANKHEIHVLYPYLIPSLKGPNSFPRKAILNCPGTRRHHSFDTKIYGWLFTNYTKAWLFGCIKMAFLWCVFEVHEAPKEKMQTIDTAFCDL